MGDNQPTFWPWKEYVDGRLADIARDVEAIHGALARRDYVDTRLEAIERATDVARRAMEKRLDGMNEFRDALKDQSARMATRQELEDKLESVEKDLRELREFRAELRGKADQQQVNIALVLSVVGIIVGIVLHFI